MNIKFIEMMTSDYQTYVINKKNILECNIEVRDEKVEDNIIKEIPIVKSLLLVIDKYYEIINCDDTEDFDIDKNNLSQIAIYYENDNIIKGYIDMTDEFENKNQENYTDGDKLYITVEEE